MVELESSVKLTNMNEGIIERILKLIEAYSEFDIRGGEFDKVKILFQWSAYLKPFNYRSKKQVDALIEEIRTIMNDIGYGSKDEKIIIENNRKKSMLKEYTNMLFETLLQGLKETGLYLKLLKNVDDLDEEFSSQSFGTESSLLDDKKKEIKEKASVDDMIKFLTPRQIHDIHARMNIYFLRSKNKTK